MLARLAARQDVTRKVNVPRHVPAPTSKVVHVTWWLCGHLVHLERFSNGARTAVTRQTMLLHRAGRVNRPQHARQAAHRPYRTAR